MDSFKSSRCFIRNKELAETPEEAVRQALLCKMVKELGFPKGLLSVERGIGGRRTDIVCYTQEMTPLLLIECKAGKLTAKALQQALGYNATVGAPFLCLANGVEAHTYWFEGTQQRSIPFLPHFKDLYAVCQRR